MTARSRVSLLTIACMLSAAASLVAAEIPVGSRSGSDPDYWSPERVVGAKPMPLPRTELATASFDSYSAEPVSEPLRHQGRAPLPDGTARGSRICEARGADTFKALGPSAHLGEPQAVGSARAYFSSSRLVPVSADTSYPYSTTGKLFFTIPGSGDFVCSASVIQRRIALTAGHCVHSGNAAQSGFYTNFMFVPSYRNGNAPNGTWAVTYLFTTSSWYSGKGKVPNTSDFAMLEIQDDSSATRIGDVTGWLGFITRDLSPNHVTMLGYPNNLDSGEQMHQVNAGSFGRQPANTVIYGSDMSHGASGGPWVQDFGEPANGESGAANYVVGVTSYLPTNTAYEYLGSSTPDQQFATLFAAVCGHQAGNCS
jgi:V8-like Glu-specific endopeptidase